MLEIIISSTFLLAIIGTYEWRLRNLNTRMIDAISKQEAEKLIDLKLEVVHSQNRDLREDIKRLEAKIDLLLRRD